MRVCAAALVCLLAVSCALVGCGTESDTSTPTAGSKVTTSADPVVLDKVPDSPPEIVVHGAGLDLTPQPGSYCWHTDNVGTCADFIAPDPAKLPVLTSAGPATFDFPIAGWEFTATFTGLPDNPSANHSTSVPLEQPTPGRFVVEAPGVNGDFQVILFGTGPQGDTSASFRWRVSAAPPEVVEWDGDGFAPPITLDLDGQRVDLDPWTACYGNGCADGAPQPPYVDVGERGTVPFSFPEPGWEFTSTFRNGEYSDCPRAITVPVRRTSDRTFEVTPAGPAGRWLVDVSGAGPGGDVITTFQWTTSQDGALPGPATGSAAVLADHDGELDSYGVEVGVDDLAAQPREASATVTVTSAEGRSVTLDTRRHGQCSSEGSLWFTASDAAGRKATTLGAGPFIYVIELDLDGTTYRGRGQWPSGETEDTAPHVPLTWTPALPAYKG